MMRDAGTRSRPSFSFFFSRFSCSRVWQGPDMTLVNSCARQPPSCGPALPRSRVMRSRGPTSAVALHRLRPDRAPARAARRAPCVWTLFLWCPGPSTTLSGTCVVAFTTGGGHHRAAVVSAGRSTAPLGSYQTPFGLAAATFGKIGGWQGSDQDMPAGCDSARAAGG